ncbi:Prolyl-tRNA editing protein ProX [Bacillus rhizoplanae]|uniref:Prolyl-tRNA editing protein ProX n=1 Tax=Bacillus rhizoplanae TaxID=2880966 RepID=A0ABM8YA12_9BACI|nr:YbaK/EbsC family protein [Bacillus rhizoplanae]CAG9612540.1 Prolyl-tRNA editing protein ProX [Bacillus rhizoplanae]
MYEEVISLLHKTNVLYEKFEHEPVLDYETDRMIRERLGLDGEPSKSLFLKTKSGAYYVFFTLEGTHLDMKQMKNMIGTSVALCSPDELRATTGCIPGCVAPFGYTEDVTIIVDSSIYQYEKILISPGVPEFTIALSTEELRKVLSTCGNTVLECG